MRIRPNMKKYIVFLFTLLCLFMDAELYAQRRNPAKNADLAFGRKQYIEAADRYKKAYKKPSATRANGPASATRWANATV